MWVTLNMSDTILFDETEDSSPEPPTVESPESKEASLSPERPKKTKRPPGRAPKGKMWDKEAGEWVDKVSDPESPKKRMKTDLMACLETALADRRRSIEGVN